MRYVESIHAFHNQCTPLMRYYERKKRSCEMGKCNCCVVPTFILRVLGGILAVSIDTVYDYPFMLGICLYVKCVNHRLVQDLGSSPGTLFGCAPVRTQGPSHKSYGKLSRSLSLGLWKNQREKLRKHALMNPYAYMH